MMDDLIHGITPLVLRGQVYRLLEIGKEVQESS